MKAPTRPRIVPPIWLFLTLVLQYVLRTYAPGPQVVPEGWHVVGVALWVVSVGAVAYSAGLFRRDRTPIHPGRVPEVLIIRGPYRWSRNPIYLAMVVTLIGFAVWLGTAVPFLAVAGFVWIIQSRFVAMEERMLRERFGDEYESYCRRVRRWI